MLPAMSSVRESEWRNRPVLWDPAFRERGVASAFVAVQRLWHPERYDEATRARAEDAAYELHEAEFRRLCAVNQIEPEAAVASSRPLRRRG
jgi:hypothetical protein